MESDGIQKSIHHAQCRETEDAATPDVCTHGVAVQVDASGMRMVDGAGMIVWQPDLADMIGKVDTSEGFKLRVDRTKTGENTYTGVVQLVAARHGTVIWDSKRGLIPGFTATTGLFTAIEKDEAAQLP